jgi:hypothetical protein
MTNTKLLRHTMCVSSWFILPEQGMTSYELLSRSSCFLIPKLTKFKNNFHVISCAHVTHPFLFKKYYPEDWLQFITEENIKVKLVNKEIFHKGNQKS